MSSDQTKKKPVFTCTLCDSDIPVEPDVKIGEILFCSYCKMGMKVVERKDGTLTIEAQEEDEE